MIEHLTVVSSIGMLIVTIIYAVYTKKIFIANKKMNDHTELVWKENNKPCVIGYFDVIKVNTVYFHIENIGKSPAIETDVRIESLSGKFTEEHILKTNLVNATILTLAPNQKISALVGFLYDVEGDKHPTFKVTSKYKSMDLSEYTDVYYFDLNIYKNKKELSIKGCHDIYNEIKQIRIIEQSKLNTVKKEDKQN